MNIWGAEWYSNNLREGVTSHIINDRITRLPVLFKTRQQARDYITKEFGYIRDRKDLRTEPHGLRVPRAVRVKVVRE